MLLIDSHCHLDSLDFSQQALDEVLTEADQKDVKHCLSVATTLSGYQAMRKLLSPYQKRLSFSCGIHPLNIHDEEFNEPLFHQLANEEGVVALGETGLDYYYDQDHIDLQKTLFRKHIQLGKQLKKPVIVHTRNAKQDTLAILKEEDVYSGVLHCFTEDLDTAKQLLDLGFYISFSGIITFKNAESIREVARYLPLDRILIETDSPYLAPVPYRGKQNKPAYVYEVANYLAALKGEDLAKVAEQTSLNFCQLFNVQGIINE